MFRKLQFRRHTSRRPARRFDGSDAPLIGAYLGPVSSTSAADMREAWLSSPLDVQVFFVPWDDRDSAITGLFEGLTECTNAGRTPLLTWEPFTPTPDETPPDLLRRAAAGAYDPYLDRWAGALRRWLAGPDGRLGTRDDRRLLLRPLHEPNGDWYPWTPASGGGAPADYVALWQSLHRKIMRNGVTASHVQWVWAVNHVDVGAIPAETLYPGDEFVDWLGVDGFNWGTSRSWSSWQDPEAVFGPMLDRVRALSTKPVCVPEFGCCSVTDEGANPLRKSTWLRESFEYFTEVDVRFAAYFDADKETDWAVFDGTAGDNDIRIDGTTYRTYSGFRAGVTEFVASG